MRVGRLHPVGRGVGNKRHASALEVKVVQPESETADAFVGIEVEAEFITALLPAKFDVRVDHVAVVLGSWIHIEADTGIQDQGPGDLLGDADAKRAQVDGLVERKGAGPLGEGDPSADRELCVIQEWFAEGPQSESRTCRQVDQGLTGAIAVRRQKGVRIGVEAETRNDGCW